MSANPCIVGYNKEHRVFVANPPSWDRRLHDTTFDIRKSKDGKFLLPDHRDVGLFLMERFSLIELSESARERAVQLMKYNATPDLTGQRFPVDHPFKNPPLQKQAMALDIAWPLQVTAMFMGIGTGKTFTSINLAAARYLAGQVNRMLVICPTSVKPVWAIEMRKHCPVPYDLHVLEAGKGKEFMAFLDSETNGRMRVLVMGVEALSQGSGHQLAKTFLERPGKVIGILDESSRIKNAQTGRTKKAIDIGGDCEYRLILTGTSITQGVHDLYSQFRFLDWRIIGSKSFVGFKAKYCVMGGYEGRQIVGYTNLRELMDRIAPYTIQISRDEMVDLPPQSYERRTVKMGPAQRKALDELGDPFLMMTTLDDKVLAVETVLERMTRYQQIVGGFFPWGKGEGRGVMPFPGSNPKLDALMDIIADLPPDTKVLVWARFLPEIGLIKDALEQAYGHGSVAVYNGATTPAQREEILERFQGDPSLRFYVSNPAMGGIGLTLTAATVAVYYSNTFSLEDRNQSEGRNYRTGQTQKVLYIDLVADHDIDRAMVEAIATKQSMADWVNRELKARHDND